MDSECRHQLQQRGASPAARACMPGCVDETAPIRAIHHRNASELAKPQCIWGRCEWWPELGFCETCIFILGGSRRPYVLTCILSASNLGTYVMSVSFSSFSFNTLQMPPYLLHKNTKRSELGPAQTPVIRLEGRQLVIYQIPHTLIWHCLMPGISLVVLFPPLLPPQSNTSHAW